MVSALYEYGTQTGGDIGTICQLTAYQLVSNDGLLPEMTSELRQVIAIALLSFGANNGEGSHQEIQRIAIKLGVAVTMVKMGRSALQSLKQYHIAKSN